MKSMYTLLAFVGSFFWRNCSFTLSTLSISNKIATRHYNIAYGNDALQTLDLCLPKNLLDSTKIVILVHSGAWFFGEKETLRPMQEFITQHNIASANINYRRNRGNITYEEQIADIDLAVSHLREEFDNLKYPLPIYSLWRECGGSSIATLWLSKSRMRGKNYLAFCPNGFLLEKLY